MITRIALPVYALLLIANAAICPNALACSPVTPSRPVVEIAPKALLSVYRAAYRQAGFQYVGKERLGDDDHTRMDFRFALPGFAEKKDGKLAIVFDLGTGGTCNPCKLHLMHMNVGDDYSLEQYYLAQKLISQKHSLAESELVRRLGDKIKPAPPMTSCGHVD